MERPHHPITRFIASLFLTGLLVLAAFAGPAEARVQSDALDPTFGSGGIRGITITDFGQIPGLKNEIFQTRVLEDGSTIVRERGDQRIWISRFHPDGSQDVNFGEGGKIPSRRFGGKLAEIQGFAMQGDSLIVASGGSYPRKRPVYIQRFGPEGKLDRSFGNNGLLRFRQNTLDRESSLLVVETDAKGRIYIAGIVASRLQLTRFLPDGSVDRSFGKSGNVRIIAAGGEINFRIDDDGIYVSSYRSLWRIFFNGEIDLAFDPQLPHGINQITDFELGADGRPLVVTDKLLTRLQKDGTPDYGFGSSGTLEIPLAYSQIELATDDSGRILLGGFRRIGGTGYLFDDSVILRWLADGTPDPGFGSGGEVLANFAPGGRDRVIGLAAGPDDSVVATGRTIAYPNWNEYLARFDQTGAPDATFGENGLLEFKVFNLSEDRIHDLARSGKKTLAVGEAGRSASFARYLANGRLDQTFGGDGKVKVATADDRWGYAAKTVTPTPEGGLLACVYGYPSVDLVKLNRNGSLDNDFGSGGVQHLDGFRRCGKVRSLGDDRYLVGGRKLEGAVVARIDGEGNFDPGYGTDGITGIPGNQIPGQLSLAFATDGTAWVADSRTMTKLNPEGEAETGFGVGGTLILDGKQGRPDGSWLAGMVVSPEGAIYLADRRGQTRVYKLNDGGRLDRRFGKGGVAWIRTKPDFKFRAEDITVSEAGKLFLAGQYDKDSCGYTCPRRAAWVTMSRDGSSSRLRALPQGKPSTFWDSLLLSVIRAGGRTVMGGSARTTSGGIDFLLVRTSR